MWHLAGEVHGEVEVNSGRIDCDRAPLHGHRGQSLIFEATPHDDIRVRKRVIASGAQPDYDVAADPLDLDRGIGCECILHVDYDPEGLVVDLHQLSSIHGQGSRFGHDDHHRVADEIDASLGE